MIKKLQNQSGVSIIAAIFIIVILAFMGLVFLTLFTATSSTSINELQSTQALYVAEGGMERALYGLRTDTVCASPPPGSVTYNNISIGQGSFTVTETLYSPAVPTTLSAAITNTDTTIPLVSTAGYAPHGRIQIDFEKIDYAGISGNNLLGARRAVAGSTAAAHASGASVFQNECLIHSVGTVGSAVRTFEASVALPGFTAFLDGNAVGVTTAGVTIATLNTGLPAGDNLVLAKISLRNTGAAGNPQMNAGTLTLVRGATLASNQFVIDVGGSATPSATNFPQETQYLVYKDVNAPANAVYTVNAQARTNNNASAEVKMFVINQAPNSSFQDGGSTLIGTTTTTMLTHNSTVPAGDNIILAVAQFDNTSNGTRSINAGNYRLNRGASILASNQFSLNLARQSRVNQGTAMLLMARDVGAPANPTYTITAQASNNGINGEVKIIVINGVLSAFLDSGSVAVGTTATVTGSLATTFQAGENLVIASTQYENPSGGQVNILAGNERITFGGVTEVASAFDINLCSAFTSTVCNDFDKGLIWRQASGLQNPTYNVEVLGSAAGMNGETKIMGIHFDYQIIGEREIFQ